MLSSIVFLLALLFIHPIYGINFYKPEDCRDVCSGSFAFHNKSDAELCCNLTRGDYRDEAAQNATYDASNVSLSSSSSTRDGGQISKCSRLGGPRYTEVYVHFPYNNQTLDSCFPIFCTGAWVEGNECGVFTTLSSGGFATTFGTATWDTNIYALSSFIVAYSLF